MSKIKLNLSFIKKWWEKITKEDETKNHEDEINIIMYNLFKDKSTEESIQLIDLVNKRFQNRLKERKIALNIIQDDAKQEKEIIDNFLV
jgi:hypothetical protein